MGKKNLEQLFKETFQGFEEVPDPKVWNNIEASLNKKKQKRLIIPIWWQLGGVAAALAIALWTINPFAEDEILDTPTISDIENTSNPSRKSKSFKEGTDSKEIETVSSESLANSDNAIDKNDAATKSYNSALKSNQNGTSVSKTEQPALASNLDNTEEDDLTSTKTYEAVDSASEKESTIAQTNPASKNNVAKTTSKEEAIIAENNEEEQKKKSIYEAIDEQKELESEIVENKADKWSFGPTVAPVYFNGSGSGSPIHPDFETNSKSGNFNMSYGVGVAYEIGSRLKIRSGVHKVNYGYDTEDIIFSSTLRTSANEKIANINYSNTGENIIVQSRNSGKSISNVDSKEIALATAPALDGKMVQQLGYIEVPLELNYALVDKKFGVDVIGGVSSLFLVDNSVLLESNEMVTEVGEANNVNALNFSANFGMGVNYDFTSKIQLNIEPVFKYQLNTFSNTSGNFRPYSIGVYSGLSFKF
ncbi:outer membrane beta-barrel protein [Flagellimonas zhangzhouensis]|uniref:Uncharacterized protein n=1 Tax=Flagellimonas zhangzhouensis TaxID=1073328 RepID=A0A1H2UMR4_9FLAO|nr:outer membrane beta-barrel protein [Allomuricauda zhangzhouensis]SDQ15550.1 hypothetical protein SAMN05216294_0622 [Allomuricauda zhangzhouensis]SDW57443.1 hypothetical protein SAMN04487892_1670 [Allomuricauda zhangzhouensis]